MKTAISIAEMKKIVSSYKKDTPETRTIIDGFIANARGDEDRYGQLAKTIIIANCKNGEAVSALLAPAEDASLKTAYNNALAAAKTDAEVVEVNNMYQWQKTTEKHKEGEWKISVLPMAYKTAKSVLSTALDLGLPLVNGESKEPFGKTALEKMIKKERLAEKLRKRDAALPETPSMEETTVWRDDDDTTPFDKVMNLIENTLAPLIAKVGPEHMEEIADALTALTLINGPALTLDKTGTEG